MYEGKNVVVVGGAGFIGVQLVRQLKERGAIVSVLDNLSRGWNREPDVGYFIADATDYDPCHDLFSSAFAVFNLAAEVAGVLHNMDHHFAMYKYNVDVLTTPVLVASELRVPHYLQTSSVCVYAPENNAPSMEHLGLEGLPHPANAGYAEAKRDGERAVLWSNLPHGVIVRPSNAFGPYDYFDDRAHVIPALIKKVLAPGDVIELYGKSDIVREFIYSTDVARGMISALEFGEDKEAYNAGTGGDNSVTIDELVDMIMDITGVKKEKYYHVDRGGGDPIRYSDADKLRNLGWSHEVGLREGLERTINWYRNR